MYELIIEKEMINGDHFYIDGKQFLYSDKPNESPLSILITKDTQELLRRTFDCLSENKINCFLEKTPE